jgi:hypothetical protein
MGIRYLDEPVKKSRIKYIDEPSTPVMPINKNNGASGSWEPQSKLQKAYEFASTPQKTAEQVIRLGANLLPEAGQTTSPTRNFIKGAPRALAETAAETVPSYFLSPESLLGAGILKGLKAAKPIIKSGARQAGKWAESWSGLEHQTPGILEDIAKNPKLLIGKGTQKAGEEYAQLFNKANQSKEFTKIAKPLKAVEKALEKAEKGALSAEDALKARQELDSIRNGVTDTFYRENRNILDKIAKSKFEKADKSFSNAKKSEQIRRILPINKSGGTSKIMSTVGGLSLGAGYLSNPLYAAVMASMAPIVQGATAAGLGTVARQVLPLVNNPAKAAEMIGFLINKLRDKENKDSGK